MKKRKLKSFVLPTLYLLITLGIFTGVVLLGSGVDLHDNYDYTTDAIEDNNEPVVNEDNDASSTIVSPVNNDKAQINIHFYSKDADEVTQQNSLIYYENTYLPNTGILYASDEEFEEHNNALRTYYYGLTNIDVAVGDEIETGKLLGTSDSHDIMNTKKTCLMEVYYNNELINPETFIGTKITNYN